MDPELFDRLHVDCDAPFECMSCGERVCPRCEVSPGEPSFCTGCAEFLGIGGAA